MKNDYWQIWAACMLMGCVGFGTGVYLGKALGATETTTKLTHEAVREKAGTWTAGEQGEAVFKWVACQPRSAAEVIKK